MQPGEFYCKMAFSCNADVTHEPVDLVDPSVVPLRMLYVGPKALRDLGRFPRQEVVLPPGAVPPHLSPHKDEFPGEPPRFHVVEPFVGAASKAEEGFRVQVWLVFRKRSADRLHCRCPVASRAVVPSMELDQLKGEIARVAEEEVELLKEVSRSEMAVEREALHAGQLPASRRSGRARNGPG